MLQEDYTTDLLDMKGAEVKIIQNDESHCMIEVTMPRKIHNCPRCKATTDKIHDYRKQYITDTPILGKIFKWLYHKRRYRCPCCGKRFAEINSFLPRYHRFTNRIVAYCLNMLKSKCSQKDVATQSGPSQATVGRWMKLLSFPAPSKLPEVLSIDEFRGNAGGEKFQCIVTDPVNKRIVDILPSRSSCKIIDWIKMMKNRKEVKYCVMDMNKVYFDIAKTFLPEAKIVIDKFHVVRYCTWAFENVRKRVQKKLLPQDRKYFKRSRRLLLARAASLSDENKQAVDIMLYYSKDLSEAYLLKELFYDFMKSKDSKEALTLLTKFRSYAESFKLPEFDACLTMLKNWQPHILNAFDCTYTNGFTEGINNSIKVIKRVAYGFKNFLNFRTRILHSLNA